MQRPDVVVIGAGMAGLAAAREIARSGYDTLILEARDRIGGRVRSDQPPGLPRAIEYGAEFVHGEDDQLAMLLKAAGLKTAAVDMPTWLSRRGGLRRLDDFWERIDAVYGAIDRDAVAFAAWLKKARVDPLSAELATNFVRTFHAAEPERMSAQVLRRLTGQFSAIARPDGRYDGVADSLWSEASAAGARLRHPWDTCAGARATWP